MESTNWRQIAAGLVGLLMLGTVGFLGQSRLNAPKSKPSVQSLKSADSQLVAKQPEVLTEIVVDVTGAVNRPGVYILEPTARVKDLLIKAGGLSKEADIDAVNRAAKLQDGMKIVILKRSQRPVALESKTKKVASSKSRQTRPSAPPTHYLKPTSAEVDEGNMPSTLPYTVSNELPDYKSGYPRQKAKVNINYGSVEQIEQVPYIGPSLAKAIVEYRNSNGSFTSIEQLSEVKGFGEKLISKVTPFIEL